ncbi:MAG TPA: ethylbenzene dehydrogenase-related protein [Anaeromyxobacteraceae bacterium]|nr:ethylbenzene dehydrogenase-related protein [Anaeromyxobacteraceae bacterium]
MKTMRIVQAFALASFLLQAPAALAQKVEPGAFNHDFLLTSVRVAGPLDTGNLDPASPAWRGKWAAAPVTRVNLMWKITANVNVEIFKLMGAGAARMLDVQSVNDGTDIAFRYSFADATQSDTIADVPLFHDAAALSVPFGVADSPFFTGCDAGPVQFDMIHMGNPCNDPTAFQCCPVGMLFWRADKGTPNAPGRTPATVPGPSESEVITGNSPGSVHEVAETDADIVHTWQSFAAKRWTVVVVRPIVSPPPLEPPEGATVICREGIVGTAPLPPGTLCTPVGNLPNLVPGATYQIVFANWDGGQQERNGHKFIGQWGDLVVR